MSIIRQSMSYQKLILILLFIYNNNIYSISPKSQLDIMKKNLPWKYINRFSDNMPTKNREYHLKYWMNQYEMRLYMLDFLKTTNIDNLTTKNFKKFLKKAHKIAAVGKNKNRVYKLRPKNITKDRQEFETGGEFRSYMPRTAETNLFETHHLQILNAAQNIEKKYGIRDIFIQSFRGFWKINLSKVSKEAFPENQYYNFYEDSIHAFIANNHPHWDYSEEYFNNMNNTFKKAWKNLYNYNELLLNLSEFYQYSINLMPFESINNSFFMNIVNMFLEKAGLKGISHGYIDFAAFNLQPQTFHLYFLEIVLTENPFLLSKDLTKQIKLSS